ncbi:uncharacterized protein [Atheta coriaria]|uniref:uncharacterized protein n=1 Tax=Dalotia coriaria TaxID=877792 RepID=UPI0031F468E2
MHNCDINLKPYSCGYMIPSYFFIDVMKSPYRITYNMFILFFIIYVGAGTVTVVSLLYTMYTYLEMFVEVLESTLGDVKRSQDRNIRRFKLMIAYRHHIFLLRFWKKIEEYYTWGMLLHIVFSGLEMALILISELIHFDILLLCHLTLYLVGTIYVGTLGEYLISLGDKIQNSTFYACPWDGDIETVKYLHFMNLNSRKGLILRAGNIAICSNALALSMYKFAYSVLMLYINTRKSKGTL